MNNKIKKFIYITLAGAILLLVDVFFLEQLFFKVKRHSIHKNQRGKKFTMLHLADLHFKNHLTYNYRRLAKVIKKIKPDIIFISGDSIDQHGNTEPLEKFLRLLDSSIPKVAVLGNHEYAADIDINKLKKVYNKTNCKLLVNASKVYNINGMRLMVTGLDDLLQGHEDFKKAVEDVGKEQHHFVLIHSPKHQEKIKQQISELNEQRSEDEQLNIYAFFAGHNHGGQVKFGNYAPHLPPQSGGYVEGWYNKKKPFLYLSKGFGTSMLPIRFWARAEVAVFDYYV